MPATMPSITMKARVAWWVRPYMEAVAWVAILTGRAPDLEKVKRRVLRGVEVTMQQDRCMRCGKEGHTASSCKQPLPSA